MKKYYEMYLLEKCALYGWIDNHWELIDSHWQKFNMELDV